jgi:hypothetical protein
MKKEFAVKKNKFTGAMIVACVVGMFAASCVRDISDNNTTIIDNEALVTLSLSVPGTPASRAMDDAQEGSVDVVDVLLFDKDDNFLYSEFFFHDFLSVLSFFYLRVGIIVDYLRKGKT